MSYMPRSLDSSHMYAVYQPCFAALAQAGLVDFAVVDLSREAGGGGGVTGGLERIELLHSRVVLERGRVSVPTVFIGVCVWVYT
jgi:hypothetical protein